MWLISLITPALANLPPLTTFGPPRASEMAMIEIPARAIRPPARHLLRSLIIAVGLLAPVANPVNIAQGEEVSFVNDVQPILREHCYECHAGTTLEGGLNLGIRTQAMQGGDSGPVIVPQDAANSLLLQLVSGQHEDRLMPPEGNARLTAQQIATLQAWVTQGAAWPENADVADPRADRARRHWAFQRLSVVTPPARDKTDTWSHNAIDLFIHQRLQQAGLRPAQRASARTLVRRLYFDLAGLPPTPAQTAAFETAFAADADAAVAALVDQLLASPHYGQRWGRHWLDVARYADSDGQEADQDRPFAWTYRDFIIDAFNQDMPYDQFVRWQLAGDEYAPDSDAAVSATGFLTAGTSFKLPDSFLESERLRNRYNELDDVISTVGSGLLGLTVACARCHDHKYDAFSAKEYYQLLGVFHSGDRVTDKLPSGQQAFFFRDFDAKRRTTWLFRRSDFYDREIEVGLGFPSLVSADVTADQFREQARRDYASHGTPASTLQRRAFADWITSTTDGGGVLLARVIVNRLWHHHFGRGLVGTTSDFGVRGDSPTHPQLLEYLCQQLITDGWRLKPLHRRMLTSRVWQQAGTPDATDPGGPQLDPANELLWHRPPQRLEAEVLRDAMLSVSQTLNPAAGGPGFKPWIAPEANLARNIKGEGYPKNAKDDASTRRRSVYMFHKRLIPYPMFQAFDRPELMTSCAARQNTTVAPQAMVLLNDRFVRAVAADFARVLHDGSADAPMDAAVITAAFERAFARSPSETERQAALDFVQAQTNLRRQRGAAEPQMAALTDFCQALFGLNEFLYVD